MLDTPCDVVPGRWSLFGLLLRDVIKGQNVSGCVLHSLDSQCAQIGIGFDLNDGCAVIAIEQLRQFGRESAQGLADNVPFIMLENCPRRAVGEPHNAFLIDGPYRSEEHTSELQSIMRIS